MRFRDIIGGIQSRRKDATIVRRTQREFRKYRNSGRIKFPRLYGYLQTPSGIQIVEEEARVIRIVLGLLAMGKDVDEVKGVLDKRGIRNRSGNLFSMREITEMPKPAYAGMIKTESGGRWVKSEHYKPIVSPEI